MEKNCKTCKHQYKSGREVPCSTCYYTIAMIENGINWEPADTIPDLCCGMYPTVTPISYKAIDLLKEYNRVTASTICSFTKGTAGYNELNNIRNKVNEYLAASPPAEKVELFEKVGEWISVEDRLPEDNEEILIWSKSEAEKAKLCGRDLKPMAVYYFDGFKHYGIRQEQEWLDSINITHWMPLPKPPVK